MARCWSNPEARGCKTCAHFEKYAGGPTCFPGRPCDCNDGYEQCGVGISLTVPDSSRTSPLVHCASWEAQP
jgi:hypothetical protein